MLLLYSLRERDARYGFSRSLASNGPPSYATDIEKEEKTSKINTARLIVAKSSIASG